jgi:hypothetical protein
LAENTKTWTFSDYHKISLVTVKNFSEDKILAHLLAGEFGENQLDAQWLALRLLAVVVVEGVVEEVQPEPHAVVVVVVVPLERQCICIL